MQLTRFVSTLGFIIGGVLLYLIGSDLSRRGLSGATRREFFAKDAKNSAESGSRHPSFPSAVTSYLYQILNTKYLILLLYLTSPAILFYSVTVFKESWGMALSLLTIYLYFRALFKKTFFSFLLTGFSLVLVFFQKYNYAGLLVLTLGLEAIVELFFFKKLRTFLWRQIGIFLPTFIFASWWIFTPTNKLGWFLDILRSDWNPVTMGLGGKLEYLLYYVQSIRVSYTFSDVLFLVLAIGYFGAIRDIGIKKIRVLFVFFTTNLILGTWHSINLQDRYILTSVPALFLLTGYELSKLAARVLPALFLRRHPSHSTFAYLPICLLVIFLLKDLAQLPSYLKSNATHMLSSPLYNESDYRDTIFDFDKNHWPKEIRNSKFEIRNYEETPEGVIDYILDNVEVKRPVEIVGYTAEISPDWMELRMAMKRRKTKYNGYNRYNGYNHYNKFLVTIEVKPASRLYTFDYRRANSWQLVKVAEIEKNFSANLIGKKDFEELGVKVKVYGLL